MRVQPRQGSGFTRSYLEFRVQGVGFGVRVVAFGVQDLGFRVKGLGPAIKQPKPWWMHSNREKEGC